MARKLVFFGSRRLVRRSRHGAFPVEQIDAGTADPGATTRDQCDLSRESHAPPPLRLLFVFRPVNFEGQPRQCREIHRGMPHEWLDTEITMPQFKTLMVLFGMNQATMGELAEALGTGVSTVTGIVDRLVDQGLVAREEDRHDRRVVVGRPTAKGLALVDRLMVATRELTTRALKRLSPEDLVRVAEGVRLLCQASAGLNSSTAASPVGARSS